MAAGVRIEEVGFTSTVVGRLLDEWREELAASDPAFAGGQGSAVGPRDFEPPSGAFLVAAVGGEPVGCGGLRPLGGGVGEVKRLFVRSGARGAGVGRALLAALEERAARRGHRRLRLDTGGHPAALALFRAAGFIEIADYNGNTRASHWFEKRLPASTAPPGG